MLGCTGLRAGVAPGGRRRVRRWQAPAVARESQVLAPTPPACVPCSSPPQTAHVGALYPAFLAMQLTAGVPPIIAALSLGFMTNLFGAITHYSSGPAAVYFGSGCARGGRALHEAAAAACQGVLGCWHGKGLACAAHAAVLARRWPPSSSPLTWPSPRPSPCCCSYLSLLEVFEYGALMALLNLAIWGGLGSAWWSWLGLL